MPRLPALLQRRTACIAAACYLIFAAIEPVGGYRFLNICLFRRFTGLPCATCGLTRGITSLLHLDLASAARWNPLGFLAFPVLIALSVALFWPQETYVRAERALRSRQTALFRFGLTLATAMALFGLIRMVLVSRGVWQFPPAPG